MKKSILQFSVIAAIAASMTLTTSCSSDESVAEAYVPEPVQFSIGVGDLSVSRASSRTQESGSAQEWTKTIGGKFAAGDLIAIYTKDADTKWYTKVYKTKDATASAGATTEITQNFDGATGQFYWASKSDKKIYEAYSYGTNTTIPNTALTDGNTSASLSFTDKFEVASNQSTGTVSEFLYGYGTLYYPPTPANVNRPTKKLIKLGHQLARVDVKVYTPKATVDITTPSAIDKQTQKDMTLTIGKAGEMALKGTFTKPTGFTTPAYTGGSDDEHKTDAGSWTPSDEAGDKGTITPRVLTAQAKITETGDYKDMFLTVYSAVVMPQDFENKDLFTIVYDGATYIYKPTGGAHKIESGKHYTYTIKVGPAAVDVDKAQIEAWSTQDDLGNPLNRDADAVLQ